MADTTRARLAAHRAAYLAVKDLETADALRVLTALAAEVIFAKFDVPTRPKVLREFDRDLRGNVQRMGEMMDEMRHQAEIADLQPKE